MRVSLLLRAAPALLMCSVVYAANTATLDEVVVTATLRNTDVEDVPSSVTVLNENALKEPQLQHFQDVLEQVPNLNWSGGTSRPRFFQLRGIGELDQYQGAPNPSVGFLIDDIDFSGVGMPATLFDVSQVEVLRGPQGTRYGANALAGLINIKTRDPGTRADGFIEASGAEHDTFSAGAAGGGPITDNLAGRVAVQRYRSDGFVKNIFLNRATNGRDETTARGKLRWQPNEIWQVDLAALYVDLDNGFDAFSVDNSLNMRSNQPGRDAQKSFGSSVIVKRTGAVADFQGTASYANSNIVYSFDGDWASDSYWGIYAPYDYFSEFLRYRRTLSADLRLLSHPGNELFGNFAWVIGAYALNLHEDNHQTDSFENVPYNILASQYQATNGALYAQGDSTLRTGTTLQVGLRGEHRSSHYIDSNDSDFGPAESMVGGNISLIQALDSMRNLYATLSRGYKAGGFNIGADVPNDRRTFDAEYLWNLETGVKGRWFDENLRGSVAMFYSRREGMQVSRSFQPDPNDPLTYVFITDNAARGENAGVEANGVYTLGQHWRVDGSLGLLRTKYIDYRYADPSGIGIRDLDGRPQAHAPSYEYSLGLTWLHPSGWSARVETSGKGSYYFDTSHDESSRAYTLVNARAGYETARWSIMLAARNVFDKNYAVRGFYFFLDPYVNAPRLYTQRGDGREVGLTARWNFLQ